MATSRALVKVGKIQQRILLIRGEKVIIDADLAEAYGVTTKVTVKLGGAQQAILSHPVILSPHRRRVSCPNCLGGRRI